MNRLEKEIENYRILAYMTVRARGSVVVYNIVRNLTEKNKYV